MLLAQLTAVPAANAAWVSRGLLKNLESRQPVAADANASLDRARLETCMQTARDLDRMGNLLDNQMIVIEDTTANIAYLRTLEGPQLPRPGRTEQQLRAEFDQRIAARAGMQRLLDRDTDAYRGQLAAYNGGVRDFDRDCAGTFRKEDLDAVKARLEME